MPYLNLDDGYPDHPKVDALSDAAFRLHTSGLAYCARELTDGLVIDARVKRLVPEFKASALKELTDARMWIKRPGGYEIHDYLDWNKPRAWWEKRKADEAKRKAEYRAKKKGDVP